MYISAEELRSKSIEQLESELPALESAYMSLRQERHSRSAERDDVRVAKKNVARCKTVMREKKLAALVEKYKGQENLPKELRPKLTKALRMKLTKTQMNRKTRSQRMHAMKYPQKVFAFNN